MVPATVLQESTRMKPTLLIADSDAELCDLFKRFLIKRGYDVETASDGLDCLAKLRRTKPVAVVLDMGLHWGGGSGVLACLREDWTTRGLAVVVTATAGHPLDTSDVREPPVIGSLRKPFTLPALLDNVRFAVAKGQEVAEKSGRIPASPELFFG
jgi:two-component system phosphate regulon response regulator PhoB